MTLPSDVRKFRLGVYTADYEQPISLMRVMGPLSAMAKEDRRLELVFPPLELPDVNAGRRGGRRLNWDWLVQCDAVFMLHPETDVHVHSASLMWQMGIPLWAEYVDDIFAVEMDNPAFQHQLELKAKRENVTSICDWAAVVTCISEINRRAVLEGLTGKLNLNLVAGGRGDGVSETEAQELFERKFLVLPEGAMWPREDRPRQKVISWRGLGSHGRDVREVLPQLMEVAMAFPDWKWLLGGDPAIVAGVKEQLEAAIGAATEGRGSGVEGKVLCQPYWPTPFEAMQAWAGQAPYLHIVPLADTRFNRSKSHLAWLEASSVGAAVIVPEHLPEWHQAGAIHYRHSNLEIKEGWAAGTLAEVLKREMSRFNNGEFHPHVRVAREAIWPPAERGSTGKTLWHMNQRRWAILRKLCDYIPGIREAKAKVEVGVN